jgi:hypothetical protein
MTIEQNAQGADTAFPEKEGGGILVWIKIAGDALNWLSVPFRRIAAGIRKSPWIAFALVVAGNIIAFNYCQERITRYYVGVLLMNIVSLNEDIDSLQAKINELNNRIDGMGAKLDKLAPPSTSALSASPSLNLLKHRSR